ncbi:ATP synthase F1 subunit epsilon [Paraburkholderia sp. BCC1885]|uniref:ATP synthase F1 subunit epsilon n=1 Tax=Paraburkholderia sp. BCC1885 TaxID=2562669 RepID=UPI0011830B02|nr:ATP synthase F1 subunit epsilon [Paraburkholderia sp. BCC1885]
MDKLLHVDILSVDELLYSGGVAFVSLPGEEGELGIYPRHAPLLTRIRPGIVRIREPGATGDQHIFVAGGVLEVRHDSVIVLADHAIRSSALDAAKADEARRKAADLRAQFAGQREREFNFAAAKSELMDELARFFALALHKVSR